MIEQFIAAFHVSQNLSQYKLFKTLNFNFPSLFQTRRTHSQRPGRESAMAREGEGGAERDSSLKLLLTSYACRMGHNNNIYPALQVLILSICLFIFVLRLAICLCAGSSGKLLQKLNSQRNSHKIEGQKLKIYGETKYIFRFLVGACVGNMFYLGWGDFILYASITFSWVLFFRK